MHGYGPTHRSMDHYHALHPWRKLTLSPNSCWASRPGVGALEPLPYSTWIVLIVLPTGCPDTKSHLSCRMLPHWLHTQTGTSEKSALCNVIQISEQAQKEVLFWRQTRKERVQYSREPESLRHAGKACQHHPRAIRAQLWKAYVSSWEASIGSLSDFIKKDPGASEMAQTVHVLASKSDDLCLIPRTYMMEGKSQHPKIVLWPEQACSDIWPPLSPYTN